MTVMMEPITPDCLSSIGSESECGSGSECDDGAGPNFWDEFWEWWCFPDTADSPSCDDGPSLWYLFWEWWCIPDTPDSPSSS